MAHIPSYFVIGHPLGHSMSPFIHSRLFALAGRPAAYEARDIPPEQLSAALRALTGLRQVMEFLARYDLPVHLSLIHI